MRNGKIFSLLFLLLCLTAFLFACGKDTGEDGSDTDSAATETDLETERIEAAEEQEPLTHELYRYFTVERETTTYDLSKVSQYEGEPVDLDERHHLLALRTREVNTKNQETDTITVYDILTGEAIHEQSVTNPLSADEEERVSLSLEIDYPVIRAEKRRLDGDGRAVYEVSYYFAKKDSEPIRTTTRADYERYDYGNGLVAFCMGDEVVWIDRQMQEIRSVSAIAAGGYDVGIFQSEYQGYLYTWDEKTVQVFNRLGLCSGIYTMSDEGKLNVHVLDNGNVLIQELKFVDVHSSYDFLWNGKRVRLSSSVMNCVDGSLSSVSLDFVVDTLETAYAERYGEGTERVFPFTLASGQDNQAIIYRFVNGSLSLYQEYVVLTNDLRVVYTVTNTTEGLTLKNAYAISDSLYVAEVREGGSSQAYVFDLDGNRIAPMSAEQFFVTERYLVTPNGVYDHRMNLLYDLSAGEFAGGLLDVDEATGRIYLSKHNFVSGGTECYLLDVETKKAQLLCDGVEQSFHMAGAGFYALRNEENGQISFCNANGETKLVVYEPLAYDWFEKAFAVVTSFEGSTVIYVVG